LVVDRDADRRREDPASDRVPLERRARAALQRELLGERIELRGGDAGADARADLRENPGDDPVRGAHVLDLVLRLEEDHPTLAATRRDTSSRVPVPSISRSSPAVR